ncbi:glycosyltransferase family 2 protein [Paenibacillus sp. SYP-B4298]|uniref:glycosyltransferase family 2 protein n=1 Tax=Paenibacillus sp. SYP-B4298 TaxID=2996034 RepID=UPI0022DDD2F6|nr:glycosyltransferase family 2 protein [Paenibacillus sp. SYP-B4298]
MITISLCIIVKDAADTIGACLSSVRDLVDEIIIVDTGSSDSTKQIVQSFTDRVYDFDWIHDFAAARNESFRHARQSHIMWLDADDVLLEEDRVKLKELKKTLAPDVDSVTMSYHYAFDEFENVTVRLRRNRLVRRDRNFLWYGAVHEYLDVRGNIIDSDIAITHRRVHTHSGRNLEIFKRRLDKGETFSPRDQFYYANELLDNGMEEQAAMAYRGLLASGEGWSEDLLTACGRLAEIYERRGEHEQAIGWALRSFDYGVPRAEFCCRLGYRFLQEDKLRQAVFWYTLATELQRPDSKWGFFNDACWTWLPHLQLCICYYRLGDFEASYRHNELARAYRPGDPNILSNKTLLEGVLRHG